MKVLPCKLRISLKEEDVPEFIEFFHKNGITYDIRKVVKEGNINRVHIIIDNEDSNR